MFELLQLMLWVSSMDEKDIYFAFAHESIGNSIKITELHAFDDLKYYSM